MSSTVLNSSGVGGSAFTPAQLGPLLLPNRFIRAGTGESMADKDGRIRPGYAVLHENLARGGVGLAFTGHIFCHPRGRYGELQAGLHDDDAIPQFRAVTDAVHRRDGRIVAQIAHAGSQSMIAGNDPLAPSAVDNVMTGRKVRAARIDEIEDVIDAFAQAARRAVEAGFDGIHLHGANGYLISQFRSPLTNRREDEWGGSRQRRDRLAVEIIRAIRGQLPPGRSFTMKVGVADLVDEPGGLSVTDAVEGIRAFVDAGLDGVEISSNLMSDYVSASIRPYVAVTRRRALADILVHRLHKSPEPEAYFLDFADAVRARVDTKVILVGGIRRLDTVDRLIAGGRADFVSMARPFIREPDLVNRLATGAQTSPACVSCNICLMHDEHHPLQCWRIPRMNLLRHARYRFTGGFGTKGSGRKPSAAEL
ncbi:NADH:flavin oxidoreductase [Mycolicibacterium parafortuitum]|uniref:NADH:flavin oxidoreductase/NADH oxidase [Desulfococcus oleovorans Hxd3] n=1 Tax=Mycolicibacterium parafortuitum TaxID=39692 RepID=A0A375YKC9_MYCPF|nr:NADH:flavin oxidoreductase [Mycolicibacterium parafortuitum]SRX81618.1 NADH:flavin oxidoreductase/NADH oxidase [Desulfococcus oleovorans Hxd3] [Mycolicibacterium parafortuitum]